MTPSKRAATFVPVALEDMEKVINRGFRALRPKRVVSPYREYQYFLTPDLEQPQYVIRINSSIFAGSAEARDNGEDSIRIVLLDTKRDKPLMDGRYQRVHRTMNWRDNLRSRIEDALEEFEDKNENRQEQIKMLQALVKKDPNAQPFIEMLENLTSGKHFMLTERQYMWVSSSYERLKP